MANICFYDYVKKEASSDNYLVKLLKRIEDCDNTEDKYRFLLEAEKILDDGNNLREMFVIHALKGVLKCQKESGDYLADFIKAFDIAEKLKLSNSVVQTALQISDFYLKQNKLEKTKIYLDNAQNNIDSSTDHLTQCRVFFKKGVYYNRMSSYFDALYYFKLAYNVVKDNKDDENLSARVLYWIGIIYKKIEDYQNALEYEFLALNIYSRLGNEAGIAITNNSLGTIYLRLEQLDKALHHFEIAVEIEERKDPSSALGDTYNNIGLVYKERREFDKAEKYYFKSLAIRNNKADFEKRANSYNNIGNVFLEKGDFDQAEKYHNNALEIRHHINSQFGLANSYANLGEIEVRKGNFEKARELLEKSFEISEKSNFGLVKKHLLELFTHIYENLAQKCMENNSFEKASEYFMTALKYQKMLTTETNQIFSSELKSKLIQIQNRHETALKRQEAEIYRLKNVELVELNRELKDKNSMILKQKSELENQHHLIQSILDNIPFPVSYKDLNGFYMGCNKAFSRYQGRKNQELIGKSVFDLMGNEQAKRLHLEDQHVIASRESLQYERKINNPLGEQRYYIINKAPFFGTDNNVIGVLSVMIDITMLKTVEKELRTSQKELKSSNEAKDILLTVIGHDLKEPMNVLSLGTELLCNVVSPDSDPKILKYTKKVHISANRIKELLDNLLQWTKTESAGIQFKPTMIDLHKKVSDAIQIYSWNAESKNLEIINDIDDNINLYADNKMISTILRNFISNAIKYSFEGGKIIVGYEKRDNKDAIFVKDTGHGITDEIAMDIGSLKKGAKGHLSPGVGLGLIIARKFAELNNGSIEYESEPDKGSTFYLILDNMETAR